MKTIRLMDLDGITGWKTYRKKSWTTAARIDGPFAVQTRAGELICMDGYLALDSKGRPYPIAKDEFDIIYEETGSCSGNSLEGPFGPNGPPFAEC